MKSEPQAFSIDDLIQRPSQTEPWDGIRNYQVRNMLRDDMKMGDLAFFYHSSCAQKGIVGVMEIVRAGYPDLTALDPNEAHYDPLSTLQNPRWYRVDVKFKYQFKKTITLAQLRQTPELSTLALLKKGSRLSIIPISQEEWLSIHALNQD